MQQPQSIGGNKNEQEGESSIRPGNGLTEQEQHNNAASNRTWKLEKERRHDKIDRIDQDIIAGEAAKLIEEVYRMVFEEKSTTDGATVDNNGGNRAVKDNMCNVANLQDDAPNDTGKSVTNVCMGRKVILT